jgi:hypothetical protein
MVRHYQAGVPRFSAWRCLQCISVQSVHGPADSVLVLLALNTRSALAYVYAAKKNRYHRPRQL